MSAGRSCPLSYRYRPADLQAHNPIEAEVLYVVGGLYGNEAALDTVLAMFAAESGRKRLVFNGDFNWFDLDDAAFVRINAAVLKHDALRGNVETELANTEGDAGCGCGYPDSVDDATVERSNAIMRQLSRMAARHPAIQAQLRSLPMTLRARVGDIDIGIVHGDAESLAGWGFAAEHLANAMHREVVGDWFDKAGVRIFASSHTCEPVYQTIEDSAGRLCHVANNGAAGMPNRPDQSFGLLTRIATTAATGALHATSIGGVDIAALPIVFNTAQWQQDFLRQWPPGSAAHSSYWERICWG